MLLIDLLYDELYMYIYYGIYILGKYRMGNIVMHNNILNYYNSVLLANVFHEYRHLFHKWIYQLLLNNEFIDPGGLYDQTIRRFISTRNRISF